MSKTGWKQVERDAAALIGARRCWANAGEREDANSPLFAQQVKNPARMSLSELGLLVEEMTVRGIDAGKIPMVVVKQSARRPTQTLVVLPAEAWLLVCDIANLDVAAGLDEEYKEWLAASRAKPNFGGYVREFLRELPGMRRRVEAYVERSKARGKKKGC